MDLVSHDLLNDNQAVLSYLELILATPGLDKKTEDYARKALSHVRACTTRIDNVKTIVSARKANESREGPVDLGAAVDDALSELPHDFPDRTVKTSKTQGKEKAEVPGGVLIRELLHTVMANIITLDQGTNVTLDVQLSGAESDGKRSWTVTMEDPNVKLKAVIKDSDMDSVHTKDVSLTTKVSGILFAKMAAEVLDGDFSIKQGKKGASFVLTLKGARI